MKIQTRLLFVVLLVALVFALPTRAQTPATASVSHADSLASLPESEMIVYFNATRILNDAMPRVVPEKELQKMRDGMDQIKAFTNVDLRHLEYIVLAMRFNKPTGTTMFHIPDAMIAIRGDFDAKALTGMAMAMSEGKLREEKFGDRSIYVLKLSDVMGKDANNPLGEAFSEISITTLDANTLAIGTTGYIKAALDAVDGRGRIRPQTLASVLRDPNVLISATGSPLVAFAKSLGLRMAENPDPNCMTRFGEYYVALTMVGEAFRINGAMNADNPTTATMLKNMLTGLLQQGKSMTPDKNAQSMIDQVKIISEGDEILVETSIPIEMAVKFVREALAPPPPKATTTETKTITKPKPKTGENPSASIEAIAFAFTLSA